MGGGWGVGILTSSLASSHSSANRSARLSVNSCHLQYTRGFGWRTRAAAQHECRVWGNYTPVTCSPIVLPPDLDKTVIFARL